MLNTLRAIAGRNTLTIVLGVLITIVSLYSPNPCIAEENKASGFVIVAKKAINNQTMERKTLRHIFMGTNTNSNYSAIHLPAGHPLRITFNTKIIGLTESRIQAYWAQLKFTGRGKPPKEMNSIEDIVNYLKKTPNVAAYFPADIQIPTGLEVIFP